MCDAFSDCKDAHCRVVNLTTSNVLPFTYTSMSALRDAITSGESVSDALAANHRKVYLSICIVFIAVLALVVLRLASHQPNSCMWDSRQMARERWACYSPR